MQKISIIIPTFNREQLIGETLDSILAQTYKNWECIVVDDGSSDYTEKLMGFYTEKDSRIQFHHRPTDRKKGANTCRNYGFELCEGAYINWFDSDDLMLPFFLQNAITLFDNKKALNLVLTDYDIFRDNKVVFHKQRNIINNLSLDYFTGKVNFGCPHVLWKREIIINFKYNEELFRAQELEFHFQILSKKNVEWAKLKETAVLVRRHDNSITACYNRAEYKSLKSELKVRKQILNYLYTFNFGSEHITPALKIYLSGFRKFSSNFSLKKSLTELKILENVISFKKKYFRWKIELIFLLLAYKLLNRNHRLKLHFKKIDGSFYD